MKTPSEWERSQWERSQAGHVYPTLPQEKALTGILGGAVHNGYMAYVPALSINWGTTDYEFRAKNDVPGNAGGLLCNIEERFNRFGTKPAHGLADSG